MEDSIVLVMIARGHQSGLRITYTLQLVLHDEAHRPAAFVPISVLLIATLRAETKTIGRNVMCDGRDADTIRDTRRRLPMGMRYT